MRFSVYIFLRFIPFWSVNNGIINHNDESNGFLNNIGLQKQDAGC